MIAKLGLGAVAALVPLSLLGVRYGHVAVDWVDSESCVGCHRGRDARLVAQWIDSPHFDARVGCEGCHGTDHDEMFAVKGDVSPKVCAACHPAAYEGFAASEHAEGEIDARDNPRFKVAPEAVQRQGCLSCHSIGKARADGTVGRCNDCHSGHRFSREEAREPEACEVCHMGPDHPQAEAWAGSKHGILYRSVKDSSLAPSCVGCHPGGPTGHNFDIDREEIVGTCLRCHSGGFTRRHMADADEIRRIADGLVQEAGQIIRELEREGLLTRMPDDRPPHPDVGHALVLGAKSQLYSDTTTVEQIYFEMTKFHHATTFKGANHFSPDHVHWLGYAELQADLTRIRDEAERLRERKK